ncbi:bifunctional short chain isoprenyl diphosphate synthase [Natrialba magadii ATCC 43099]|uniref:Bifunctional short chain isoprenyl diphosphate synthase n=1 Tax=Natrialba magadii (strain ATCC 43099 / DSM 3394 / CCM 3739 / CIP 104546 / IAM 13178 / JCM 8861 / NBRC 102185 / NCIMB 2190 / MS3) TaxID=547559 RepID=D3ST18_NATMM|nr:polyprenyl synthetase family protein [Natrialba magadii]ADD04964.1 bifunctional short chain isoprenyl diphosphate synthase [Natrialba magadii ATCC 43099]ELY24012.1 polyprenyl synthetase [Natrialba magadii ATCC 43099]
MELLERRRALIEERLHEVVDGVDPETLSDEVRHVTLSGGKRVRPMVTILACETVGGTAEDAVEFGVGIELVHNASLVIDDIIDRSELRRGTESAWAEFGYGPAIITSDGLLGEAFDLFASDPDAMRVVTESMVELGVGEATELSAMPSNEEEYMTLARRKTGALFRAAAELGAIAADSDAVTVEALGEYAERVGIAFQIRDDVLDAVADAEELGKPTGHDAEMDRPSVVQVTDLTPEEANARARAEADRALEALDRVDVADPTAEGYLRELAEFVVERER